jgi:hypothetical protein
VPAHTLTAAIRTIAARPLSHGSISPRRIA